MQYPLKARLLAHNSRVIDKCNICAGQCVNLGAATGIQPVSPAFWAGVVTYTPQDPGT